MFGTFVVSVSLENSDFIVVNPPIYGVLWSFTKLINKKIKRAHVYRVNTQILRNI